MLVKVKKKILVNEEKRSLIGYNQLLVVGLVSAFGDLALQFNL